MFPRTALKTINGRGTSAALRIASGSRSSRSAFRTFHHIRTHQIPLQAQRIQYLSRCAVSNSLLVAERRQSVISVLQQSRMASSKSEDAASKPRPSKKEAESPWTEEPRSPAPDSIEGLKGSEVDAEPEFPSKLRRAAEEGNDAPQDTPQYTGPLPDLRQGIPSSFNPNTSDTSSSFKTPDSAPPELNLTEDPTSGGGRYEDESPKGPYVSSIDRRRQFVARYAYLAAAGFALGAFGWLGRDWDDENEAKAHPDAPSGASPIAWYHRFVERLGGQFSHYTEPAFPQLLPDPPADPNQRMPYTLVLSLEDLLVTSTWSRQDGYKIAKRPGVDYFLRYLCQYYELVIFTTVTTANGDLVLRQLDPYTLCLPIFRDGTRYMNGEHVKVS